MSFTPTQSAAGSLLSGQRPRPTGAGYGFYQTNKALCWLLVASLSVCLPLVFLAIVQRFLSPGVHPWYVCLGFEFWCFLPFLVMVIVLRTFFRREALSGPTESAIEPHREPDHWAWAILAIDCFVAMSLGYFGHDRPQVRPPMDVLVDSLPKLALAVAIGVLVVFFVNFVAKYEEIIRASAATAQNYIALNKTEQESHRALKEANALLHAQTTNIDNTIRTWSDNIEQYYAEIATHKVQTLLRRYYDMTDDVIYKTAADRLNEDFNKFLKIHTRVLDNKKENHQSVALIALYVAYCNTERLAFGDGASLGTCQFATRFEHYALAVRTVVQQLFRLSARNRNNVPALKDYEFYALSTTPCEEWLTRSKEPIIGHISPDWLIFLERFVIWSKFFRIKWHRLYVPSGRSFDSDAGKGPYVVLCHKAKLRYTEKNPEDVQGLSEAKEDLFAGKAHRYEERTLLLPVVAWKTIDMNTHREKNPDLWNEAAKNGPQDELLVHFADRVRAEAETEIAKRIVRRFLEREDDTPEPRMYVYNLNDIKREFRGVGTPRDDEPADGFTIVKESDSKATVRYGDQQAALYFGTSDIPALLGKMDEGDFAWVPMEDLIRETYHPDSSLDCEAGKLRYTERARQERKDVTLFSKGVPRDLFAVRYREGEKSPFEWILCMGAPSSDALTERGVVDLTYASQAVDGTAWEPIGSMLNQIFPQSRKDRDKSLFVVDNIGQGSSGLGSSSP